MEKIVDPNPVQDVPFVIEYANEFVDKELYEDVSLPNDVKVVNPNPVHMVPFKLFANAFVPSPVATK
jgi:hypothetical protein